MPRKVQLYSFFWRYRAKPGRRPSRWHRGGHGAYKLATARYVFQNVLLWATERGLEGSLRPVAAEHQWCETCEQMPWVA